MIGTLAVLGLAAGNQALNTERTVAFVGYAVDYKQFHC